MSEIAKIHQGKMPVRRHFIEEWAEVRNLRPVDIANELGVDKSQVGRWFKGQMPGASTQARIAALFEIEPSALLRHPDADWMSRFFEGRAAEERDRIKQAMETFFPPKTGT